MQFNFSSHWKVKYKQNISFEIRQKLLIVFKNLSVIFINLAKSQDFSQKLKTKDIWPLSMFRNKLIFLLEASLFKPFNLYKILIFTKEIHEN